MQNLAHSLYFREISSRMPHEAIPLWFAIPWCPKQWHEQMRQMHNIDCDLNVPTKMLKKASSTTVNYFCEIVPPWPTFLPKLLVRRSLNNWTSSWAVPLINILWIDARHVQRVEYRHYFPLVKRLLLVNERKLRRNYWHCIFSTVVASSIEPQINR